MDTVLRDNNIKLLLDMHRLHQKLPFRLIGNRGSYNAVVGRLSHMGDFRSTINCGFLWADSIEGRMFWSGISSCLSSGRPLRELCRETLR